MPCDCNIFLTQPSSNLTKIMQEEVRRSKKCCEQIQFTLKCVKYSSLKITQTIWRNNYIFLHCITKYPSQNHQISVVGDDNKKTNKKTSIFFILYASFFNQNLEICIYSEISLNMQPYRYGNCQNKYMDTQILYMA